MFGKRKGRNRRLTNRKGVPAARKTKGKLKTAAKKSIEESNNLDTGTGSHIDLDELVRETEKSFSDVEMGNEEEGDSQGEELEILPGTSGIFSQESPSKQDEIQTVQELNTNGQQNSTTIDEERLQAFEEAVEDEVARDRDPDYVPVRKSDRLKGKDRLEYSFRQRNHFRDPERIKSENEKKEFYDAIRKYGTKDLESVMAALPDRTEDSVTRLIQIEKKKQAYTEEKRAIRDDGTYEVVGNILKRIQEPKKSDSMPASRSETPEHLWRENFTEMENKMVKIETHSAIDHWIGNIKSIRDKNDTARVKAGVAKAPHCEKMISNSLNWIAEFEDHPDPDTCGGIDYAAIYRYFACISEGEVPPTLNPVTSARVTRLLSDISYLAIGNLNSNETDYLENYKGRLSRYTTTENFDEKSSGVAQFDKITSLPGLNPLNIHPELCADKNLDLSKITMLVEPGVLERSQAIDPKKFDIL